MTSRRVRSGIPIRWSCLPAIKTQSPTTSGASVRRRLAPIPASHADCDSAWRPESLGLFRIRIRIGSGSGRVELLARLDFEFSKARVAGDTRDAAVVQIV